MTPPGRRFSPMLGQGLLSAALYALIWWALAGASVAGWLMGIPVVAVAVVHRIRRPGPRVLHSPVGALRFTLFFLWRALVSGVDVARRVLHPSLPITPHFRRYRLRLPAGHGSAVLFANIINLLPGTLCISMVHGRLLLHSLAPSPFLQRELRTVEDAIARMAGLHPLPDRGAR